MGGQYQHPKPAAGCTQDAHLDLDTVTGRFTPPLQICPWDGCNADALLLLIPPTHMALHQWQEAPVSSNRSLMVPMLWCMAPGELPAWGLPQTPGRDGCCSLPWE